MKTIHLRNTDENDLKNNLLLHFPEWNGIDSELPTQSNLYAHYIGRIATSFEPLEFLDGFHANVLAPDDFDPDSFTSEKVEPETPVHLFLY